LLANAASIASSIAAAYSAPTGVAAARAAYGASPAATVSQAVNAVVEAAAGIPRIANGLIESAMSVIAHDPSGAIPAPADDAAAPVAAMFETPVVAIHRIPASFARTSAEARRGARPAMIDPTAEAPRAVVVAAAATRASAPIAVIDDTTGDGPAITISRTTSYFGRAASEADVAGAPQLARPTITPMPIVDRTATALTPLEQAVQELVVRLTGDGAKHEPPADDRGFDALSFQSASLQALPLGASASAGPAAASEPVRPGQVTQPEPPANPSHVHLVVDDGPDRVVVTVAMRGNEVYVAMRGNDDATTASLARNAGALEHAMRARGLSLNELTTQREPPQRSPHSHDEPPEPHRRRKPSESYNEAFELEEKP
jgi:hypothetical protein